MCKHGDTTTVRLKVPADLSCTGKTRWASKQIDTCIADLVRALQCGGIDMRSSCCGHGLDVGEIQLQDGRRLLVEPKETKYTWHDTLPLLRIIEKADLLLRSIRAGDTPIWQSADAMARWLTEVDAWLQVNPQTPYKGKTQKSHDVAKR